MGEISCQGENMVLTYRKTPSILALKYNLYYIMDQPPALAGESNSGQAPNEPIPNQDPLGSVTPPPPSPPPSESLQGGSPSSPVSPMSESQVAPVSPMRGELSTPAQSEQPVLPSSPPAEPQVPSPMPDLPEPLPIEQPLVGNANPPPPPEPPAPVVPPPPPPTSGGVFLTDAPMAQQEQDLTLAPSTPWFKSKIFLSLSIVLFTAILVVGGLFIFQNINKEPQVVQAPTEENEGIPQPPETELLTLSLIGPAEGEITTTEEIVVKGKTSPNTTVMFFTDADQNSLQSDATGAFSGRVKMRLGINELSVSAISKTGEVKNETRQMVYDSE